MIHCSKKGNFLTLREKLLNFKISKELSNIFPYPGVVNNNTMCDGDCETWALWSKNGIGWVRGASVACVQT